MYTLIGTAKLNDVDPQAWLADVLARIAELPHTRVHFMTEHGERIGLARSDPQLRHLDHAYSSTVHAAQGRTVRSVIAVLGAAGLTDQTMLYVEMSRACDEFVLLTDDRAALAEVLVHRPGLEESALEAIGEALTTPPVVEPEVFDKLRADWAAVRTRAETTGDIAYFTDGYTDVMARAAALSAIEDLPADMRRFTAALLAEHKQHRARERTVTGLIRRMQSHWRRWPELGWASPDPATEQPPAHRRWRADANRMLDTARAWLAGDGAVAPHLDAMPGVRAGLETAVCELDRTCVRDNYRFFERLWHGLRTNEGESMVYGRRYDEVTALGEALMDCDELTPTQHAVLGQWRAAHEQAMARRAEIERYPDEAAVLIDAGRYLDVPEERDATDDPADPMDPTHRKWRNDVTESRTNARAMLAPGSVYAPHLSARPDLGAALRRAAADLDDALRTHACRGLAWLVNEVGRSAEAAGTIPFYAPRYDELAAWAESLGDTDGLPDATRRLLAEWRTDHDACLGRRAEIEAFPDRAVALLAVRDGHGPWRRDATTLIEAGRDMLADAPGDRPHLDAMPGVRNRIAEALSPLVRALRDESMSASADSDYIVPCRDRVLPGDRIRCTVHGRSGYGFSTGDEKVRIEGEVQDVRGHFLVSMRITACPHDRGPSPGSEPLIPMSELLEFRCFRALWEDEEARARLEADVRRENARLDESVARQLLERDRRHGRDIDRGEDYDRSW